MKNVEEAVADAQEKRVLARRAARTQLPGIGDRAQDPVAKEISAALARATKK